MYKNLCEKSITEKCRGRRRPIGKDRDVARKKEDLVERTGDRCDEPARRHLSPPGEPATKGRVHARLTHTHTPPHPIRQPYEGRCRRMQPAGSSQPHTPQDSPASILCAAGRQAPALRPAS